MKNHRQRVLKKLVSLVLLIILLFGQLPISSFATSIKEKTIESTNSYQVAAAGKQSVPIKETDETTNAKGIKKKTKEYQEENGENAGNGTEQDSYTFDNLEKATYNVYAVVTDVAGNKVVVGKDGKVIPGATVEDAENGTVEGDKVTTDVIPDLTEKEEGSGSTGTTGNTTFTYSPEGWTNGKVTVKVETTANMEDYHFEYSTDLNDWDDYPKDGIPVENNTKVYVRLTDGTRSGKYATGEVKNIDKDLPTGSTTVQSATSNSITVKLSASDSDSGIGVVTWYYKDSDGHVDSQSKTYKELYSEDSGQTSITDDTFTLTNIKSGSYKVYAVLSDVAGNTVVIGKNGVISDKSEQDAKDGTIDDDDTSEVTPTPLPELSGGEKDGEGGGNPDVENPNTSFHYNPDGWTNGKIKVTITTSEIKDGYSLEYKTNETGKTDWTSYPQDGFDVSENTTVYARLTDGTNYSNYIAGNITKIEKNPPTGSAQKTASTANTITVQVTANDAAGESGIGTITWYWQKDGGDVQHKSIEYTAPHSADAGLQTRTEEYEIPELEAGTYKVYALITDVAGNESVVGKDGVITGKTKAQAESGDIDDSDVDQVTTEPEKPGTVGDLETKNNTPIYVEYPDGTGVDRLCVVLYDKAFNQKSGTKFGTQIITADSVEKLTLNWSPIDTGINTFNNGVEILNNATNKYLNPNFATDVRCVGSYPSNKNSQGTTYVNIGNKNIRERSLTPGGKTWDEDRCNDLKIISTPSDEEYYYAYFWCADSHDRSVRLDGEKIFTFDGMPWN